MRRSPECFATMMGLGTVRMHQFAMYIRSGSRRVAPGIQYMRASHREWLATAEIRHQQECKFYRGQSKKSQLDAVRWCHAGNQRALVRSAPPHPFEIPPNAPLWKNILGNRDFSRIGLGSAQGERNYATGGWRCTLSRVCFRFRGERGTDRGCPPFPCSVPPPPRYAVVGR